MSECPIHQHKETDAMIANIKEDVKKNCAAVKTKLDRLWFVRILGILAAVIVGCYGFTFGIYKAMSEEIKDNQENAETICSGIASKYYRLERKSDVTGIMFDQINGKLNTIIEQNKEINANLKDHDRRIDRLEWDNDHVPN